MVQTVSPEVVFIAGGERWPWLRVSFFFAGKKRGREGRRRHARREAGVQAGSRARGFYTPQALPAKARAAWGAHARYRRRTTTLLQSPPALLSDFSKKSFLEISLLCKMQCFPIN